MASGVKVNDECKAVYQQVKMKKAGQVKRRYVVLRLNEQLTEVVVDKDCTQDCDRPFLDVVGDLPRDDGRYLVYDYDYSSSVGQASKVIMVMWCPGSMPVKKRMLYASSKDAVKKAFSDLSGADFHAECVEDIDPSEIEQKIRKF